MTADPSYAFQVGLASALLASTAVTGLVGKNVLDASASEGASYPLIELGQDEILPTDHTAGAQSEVVATLHIWADGSGGRLLAKQIYGVLRDLLTSADAVTIDGHVVVSVIAEHVQHLWEVDEADPSAAVAHTVAVFRFQTRPAPAP